MCGIAGIFSYQEAPSPVDPQELRRIRERMTARGPDGAGTWISSCARIGLAHRRLAIIDPTLDGAQPMANGNGSLQIVFNGEIYNYRELRQDLRCHGAVFRTNSDTEVLLHMFAKHGPDMCRSLRGMFAFAIWDNEAQTLFLARDQFGIKPLYIHDDGAVFRFASQVKALLAGGGIESGPELAGHVGYWIWGHVPEPWTLHRGILSVEPGSWLSVERGGRIKRGVFESVENIFLADRGGPADVPGGAISVRDSGSIAPPSLRETLLDSVRHHLIADVPVGVFLSSGIDSATIAALASELGAGLRTVTLGFEEFRGTQADETTLAEKVAALYGTRHETVWVSDAEFTDSVGSFLESMDQPSVDGLNTWLVSRATAGAGLKVALSGLGGDELFEGYPSFRHVPGMRALARPFGLLPGAGRQMRKAIRLLLPASMSPKYAGLLEYGATWEGAYLLRRAVRMPWELDEFLALDPRVIAEGVDRLFSPKREERAFAGLGSPRQVVSYLELTRYMRCQLLRDSDWAGMAHSLEIRVPFVDRAVAGEIAARRRGGVAGYSKRDLARTANPSLPDVLVNRRKTGFTVPTRYWTSSGSDTELRDRGNRGWQRMVGRSFACLGV